MSRASVQPQKCATAARGRAFILLFAIASARFTYAEACKYGLEVTYGAEPCSTIESQALQRVGNAKTVCTSANSEVQWNKNNKEPSWAWAAIRAGSSVAINGFTVASCENADLVVKYVYDDMSETVKITVTDAESSAVVFEESRSVSDLRSDAVRMANHWHEMVADARAAKRASILAAKEAERERERRSKEDEETRRCQAEFDSLKQNIRAYIEVQHVPVPQTLLNWISAHNTRCTNQISPEIVKQEEKAEEDAKHAQEEVARQESLRQKRAVQLQQEKAAALVAWKQKLSSAAFVPPVEGWTNAANLPNSLYYIILPGSGFAPNCHFATDKARPSLDCLGGAGRHDYFSAQNGNRWYLLKSKWTASGEYATTVKEGGLTICFRKAGCYPVLAEVRPDPTELPEKYQVPTPGSVSLSYSNDDFSFSYPQNWEAQERKNKDTVLSQVGVAPPEAHLANWVTHGVFAGHVNKTRSPGESATLEGVYNQFVSVQRDRGLAVEEAKEAIQIGDSRGKIVRYTSQSVLTAGESGWIAVVKDKGEGYYWIMMFYPSNDDSHLYGETFGTILKSFKFKK